MGFALAQPILHFATVPAKKDDGVMADAISSTNLSAAGRIPACKVMEMEGMIRPTAADSGHGEGV
jgi:hypothetical protein